MNRCILNLIIFNKNNRFINNVAHNLISKKSYCFKSDLSLDKLYPNSVLDIRTISEYRNSKNDNKFSGYIPMDQIQITYSRSSGPGGQNVNCVNTKVDLRFHVESSNWIPEKVRKRLLEEFRNKISKEGYFIIKSDVTRSQQMNLADALEKLRCLIRELEKEKLPPTEETLEKIRRRQERAARERLMMKRNRSQIKADRREPNVNEI